MEKRKIISFFFYYVGSFVLHLCVLQFILLAFKALVHILPILPKRTNSKLLKYIFFLWTFNEYIMEVIFNEKCNSELEIISSMNKMHSKQLFMLNIFNCNYRNTLVK